MGLFNAILVQFIAIPAIVATLATLSMYRGLSQALSDGEQVTGLPADNSFFTFLGGDVARPPGERLGPDPRRDRADRWCCASRRTATACGRSARTPRRRRSRGISIPRVRVQTLVLIGALCGPARACSALAFFISGDPNIGTGFELQAIAAAVIGGTPLRGGSATVVGAVLGSILLSAVNSGLAYFDVPVNWSYVRDRRSDPHRRRPRQPHPRPSPASPTGLDL